MRVYHSATTARLFSCGTESGTRTRTTSRPPVFETGASTIPPSRPAPIEEMGAKALTPLSTAMHTSLHDGPESVKD